MGIKRKKRFYLIVAILVLIEIASIFLMYKSSSGEITLDDVKLKNKRNDSFAIMLEQTDGTYIQSDSDAWPTDMKYNSEKSGCMDANGNIISESLTYDSSTNTATVKTNGATYCYLYFDIMPTLSELCSNGDNLGSCLTTNNSEIESLNDSVEGGLYRYQGTNDTVNDNYICFGTTDKSECTSNTDAYMYRIIGVNENGQLKLIKKEALESTMQWYSDYTTDITWPNSTIYSNINGSSFLTNTTYVPSGWSDKIATTSWKYGDNTSVNYTASELYDIENAWTTTTSAKIGLIYAHDYFYAYQSGGLNCSNSGDYSTCKTAWMFLGICDSGAPNTAEWTMSRYGQGSNSRYFVWHVGSYGYIYADLPDGTHSIRPVFYLNADEVYTSGTGTIDDPIIINEPEPTAAETIKEMQTTGLNTTMEGGLYRYQGTSVDNYICFGTSDKSTCTGNTDAYMYRIIGVASDGRIKVLKNEALNSSMLWYSDYTTDIAWPSSTIYSNINGSTFLSNTTYVPSGWSDKIATTTWKYGDNLNVNVTAANLYATENAWTNTTSAKIGLIYAHDYAYAYQSGGLNCSSSGSYPTCKTAWMFLGICDSSASHSYEWTMSRYGYYSDNYYAWYVNSNGAVDWNYPIHTYSVRPVFYLTSDVEFVGGTGTSSDPFIIK